jgi:hypothetical protein
MPILTLIEEPLGEKLAALSEISQESRAGEYDLIGRLLSVLWRNRF